MSGLPSLLASTSWELAPLHSLRTSGVGSRRRASSGVVPPPAPAPLLQATAKNSTPTIQSGWLVRGSRITELGPLPTAPDPTNTAGSLRFPPRWGQAPRGYQGCPAAGGVDSMYGAT